ncbi:hypothetical protein KC19_1G203300 [Ceratodon purpureus]|uniref:Secreted protein n=1 Tax=Ceratodon purpureus TaxID=3225 RepID=A0A8T0J9J6_CERPU|nr:hypothetical protein KC19_1G203300 [Ceratodon purpureus]
MFRICFQILFIFGLHLCEDWTHGEWAFNLKLLMVSRPCVHTIFCSVSCRCAAEFHVLFDNYRTTTFRVLS